MINKINRLYSIFYDDVILSVNDRINAIEGYDVIKQLDVLSSKDVCRALSRSEVKQIPDNELWLFKNPASEDKWYIGQHIIAFSHKGLKINILAMYSEHAAIITSTNVLVEFRQLLSSINNIKIVPIIGALSTPHKVMYNSYLHTGQLFNLPFNI